MHNSVHTDLARGWGEGGKPSNGGGGKGREPSREEDPQEWFNRSTPDTCEQVCDSWQLFFLSFV